MTAVMSCGCCEIIGGCDGGMDEWMFCRRLFCFDPSFHERCVGALT